MLRIVSRSFVVALVAACHSSSPARPAAPGAALVIADDRCPMGVAGTAVAVEDTATGAALVFASTGDLPSLRARVDGWATRHNQRHGAMGPLPTGDETAAAAPAGGDPHAHHHHHGGGEAGGAAARSSDPDPAAWINAHSRAEASETAQGTRLTFTTFPDQVPALQTELRRSAEQLGSSGCGAS